VTETDETRRELDWRAAADTDAAAWDARLRAHDCSAEERARFQRWLQQSPDNAEQYDSLQRGIEALQAASATHPRLRAMRDHAMAARGRSRGTRIAMRAAAAALLFIIVGVFAAQWRTSPIEERAIASVFQTAIGERSTVQLQDGSEISLDTRSRVEVAYSAARRSIDIAEGRAYFRVAKDAERPFAVNVAGSEIIAIGTEFDVRLDADYLYVTLIEGRIDVHTAAQTGDASTPRSLAPGQRLIVDRDDGTVSIEKADLEKVVSWKEGKILFEDTPLDEVIAELNRYSNARIVVEDANLAQLRVNGLFHTEDPSHFLQALTQYLPIRLRVKSDGTTYISQGRARG
jgi:transmembrane sensor